MIGDAHVVYVIIGKALKIRRKQLRLKMKVMAQKLGIVPQQVCNWESGKCFPPDRLLPKIADLLSMSRKDIVKLYTDACKEAFEEYIRLSWPKERKKKVTG